MARGIALKRQQQAYVPVGAAVGVRLTIQAYSAVNMTNHVFVHRRVGTKDEFVHVATPYAISVYPVDTPGQDGYFRKTSLDVVFKTETEALEAWKAIQEEVKALIAALDAADALSQIEKVPIGDASLSL